MINIFAQQERFFVWNCDDVMKLRKEHRIIGSLIGCLPRQSFQNTNNWLPLYLSSEEAKLLVDKGIGTIVSNSAVSSEPSPETTSLYWSNRNQKCAEQITLYKKIREDFVAEKVDEIIQNKQVALALGKQNKQRYRVKNLIHRIRTQMKEWQEAENGADEDCFSRKRAKVDDDSNLPSDSTLHCGSDKTPCKDGASNGSSSLLPEQKSDNEAAASSSSSLLPEHKTDNEAAVSSSSSFLPGQKSDNETVASDSSLLHEQKGVNEGTSSSSTSANSCGESMDTNQGPSSESPNMSMKRAFLEKEVSKIHSSINGSMVELFTECIWKKPEENIPISWSFPKTEKEKLKYMVFKDLWEKGFYITSGMKFGGDYLVYAGDPIKCHALYIIHCIAPTQNFSAEDVISFGRVGNQVKKTFVLASMSTTGSVEYLSLSWASDLVSQKASDTEV